MKFSVRNYNGETDYWNIRDFLREIFILNNRLEHSWHLSRWDYFRWHLYENCRICGPLTETVFIWETAENKIVAVLNPIEPSEAFIHIHPAFRTCELEKDILEYAEKYLNNLNNNSLRRLYVPVDENDDMRKKVLFQLGFVGNGNTGWEHYQDLDISIQEPEVPAGFVLRSMGDVDEHQARNIASWLAFHPNEPIQNFDSDPTWYTNIQRCPLYRRDLDIVVASRSGELITFCTIFYDDMTRSAVADLVGTIEPYWRKGFSKAALREGMIRLKRLGCLRLFAKATDTIADLFYSKVMKERYISETWVKDL